MTERRQIDRRKKQKLFHFPTVHIGRKLWLCFVALFLIVAGYIHCQLAGAQNYETYCWAIIAVLGVFSGTTVAQKFSPYGSYGMNGGIGGYQSLGGGMYPPYQDPNITAGVIPNQPINPIAEK
jgi:hypothetical protein